MGAEKAAFGLFADGLGGGLTTGTEKRHVCGVFCVSGFDGVLIIR